MYEENQKLDSLFKTHTLANMYVYIILNIETMINVRCQYECNGCGFKVLGDANRLEIVQMLSDGEKCGINFWKDLKLPSQLYPMMNFPCS